MTLDRGVGSQELLIEMATPRGATFLLWRLLHEQDDTIELDDLRRAFPLSDAELFHTMLEVLGMADKEEPQVDPLGLTENP